MTEPKVVKNRVHVDLRAADSAAEIKRLVALGARLLPTQPTDLDLVALQDPEGNEFCVGAV